MRTSHTSAYQEMMINSKLLEVPRGTYQRELRVNRVRRIAAKFDAELRRSLIPVCSTLPRSATATVTIMCLTGSIPSQSSSCSTVARTC